jgi:hypothetical protein
MGEFGSCLQADAGNSCGQLNYAQVIKRYTRRKLRYITRRILCGSLKAFTNRLISAGLSGLISTYAVERVNLGLRTGVSALCRRSAQY